MKITLAAMKYRQGGREAFSTIVQLGEVPRLCTFRDWSELSPRQRLQRTLNKGRIPGIARYILDHEEGYVFSSIVVNYKGDATFVPVSPDSPLGFLEIDGDTLFLTADGQHRAAGIAGALKENPDLATDNITMLLYKFESTERAQQMFSDLNRNMVKTSGSINILYDHGDSLARITLDMMEKVPIFADPRVEMEKTTISQKSPALVTLQALYKANKEYLAPHANMLDADKVAALTEYWTFVTEHIPTWQAVLAEKLAAADLRKDSISTHASILLALGHVGGQARALYPDWREKLASLKSIDFAKTNPDFKANGIIVAESVLSNTQARNAAIRLIWRKLGLPEAAVLPAEPETPAAEKKPRKKKTAETPAAPAAAVAAAPETPAEMELTPAMVATLRKLLAEKKPVTRARREKARAA